MPNHVQEIYREQILPMSEKERLQLAALIINDLSHSSPTYQSKESSGGIREMFGTWRSGNPNSAENEQIDADLAKVYADNHEDEV